MPLHGVIHHGRRDSLKSQSIQVTEKPVSRRSWFQAGNRSSTEGDRQPDAGVEDDTTVVEPDQNNGESMRQLQGIADKLSIQSSHTSYHNSGRARTCRE